MKFILYSWILVGVLFLAECEADPPTSVKPEPVSAKEDPLPPWNDGKSKQEILDFVTKTAKKDSPDFIPEADRITCFDNEGTLWSEQPMYFQLAYALDYIKKEATTHPDWKTKEPFKSVFADDMKSVMAEGEHGLVKLVLTSHTGMTTKQFDQYAKGWIDTA